MSLIKKILEVFTKDYRQETEYREFLEENINRIKLKSQEHFDFTKGLQNLVDANFQSNFHISTDNEEKNIGREPGE